jgi:hypothetical protein
MINIRNAALIDVFTQMHVSGLDIDNATFQNLCGRSLPAGWDTMLREAKIMWNEEFIAPRLEEAREFGWDWWV